MPKAPRSAFSALEARSFFFRLALGVVLGVLAWGVNNWRLEILLKGSPLFILGPLFVLGAFVLGGPTAGIAAVLWGYASRVQWGWVPSIALAIYAIEGVFVWWLLPRTRSISMSIYMNGKPSRESKAYGDYEKCWHKTMQIQNPGPSKAAVFVDEHESSIQQALFCINAPDQWLHFGMPLWSWISFPATRHGGGGTLSFADGHTELWRWIEPNTTRLAGLPPWLVLKPGAGANDRDLTKLFNAVPAKVPIQ